MFAFHCPRHGARVLVWTSQVETAVNGPDGVGLVFHCSCGYRGMLITGATGSDTVVPLEPDYVVVA